MLQSTLNVGDIAPDFSLTATGGRTVHLYDTLKVSPVVLFFFLKAFTPVCMAEVCCFREKMSEFEALDAAVYGISSDSVLNQERFAGAYHLPFPLLSDANNRVRALYRVPKALGLLPGRSTYVIGRDKIIKSILHSQLAANLHVSGSLRSLGGPVD